MMCKRGHLRTEETIYAYRDGRTECRPCRTERSNERQKSHAGARPCSVDECSRGSYGFGLCKMHYDRKRRTGTTDLIDRLGSTFPCGCDRSENTYIDKTSGVAVCRSHRNQHRREWAEGKREQLREYQRKWYLNHPGAKSMHDGIYKIRRRGVEHVPYGGLPAIFERDEGICGYCGVETLLGAPSSNLRQATVDHVVPVSLGGPDINENVVLACRLCNNRKTNRPVEEFINA